ncbi:K Homology domain, type 1 [Dillenia turbinata]|uniref:K Homology domain, type 1 n=1 Tax=Dillenia turbinata TaxID=194707 RepID=A0AAN8VAY6_9MAGN
MAGQRNSYGKRSHSQSDYGDNEGSKRRNPEDDKDPFTIGSEDTVYRYLCPAKRIGSIIGKGGEIVKQLRVDTKAKIRIGETVPGCEERVVTIYSSSDETNSFDDSDSYVCPAQDALFRGHDRVVAEEMSADEDSEGPQVTIRLLVPSDQIGCVIGKGGQIVQNIRSDTGAQVRILKNENLPSCALSSDELLQISGGASVVRKALYEVASRLHDNPSRSQHLLATAVPSVHQAGGSLVGPAGGAPIMGLAPLVVPYGGYKVSCIGGVIGKGGAIIKQIRQDSRAGIKVDSSAVEGDDCLITISTKEVFKDTLSPTIDAAVRLQPRCSEKAERDSGITSFTTRLLVPTSRIGCLIGKGGAIITELRRVTQANIRILSKENLPKIAAQDDEMVQITGELDVAKVALVQIATRLRANLFDREGTMSAFVPVLPYLPMQTDSMDGLDYESRNAKRHARGHSYSAAAYGGSSDLPAADGYGSYGGLSSGGGSGSCYGAYGGYSSARGGTSG